MPLEQAVKSGGPSEENNKLLADIIKEAKLSSVPKDNITRAIKRAVDGSQGDFKEVVYEVRMPSGVPLSKYCYIHRAKQSRHLRTLYIARSSCGV